MKTKNFFISLLLALLLMPVGAKAAETMDFTDDVTNIMYTIRISSDNVPEAAVVTGIKAPKSTMTQLPGTVDLTIPETLTFGNSGTSYTIPIIGIQSVSVNGKGNGNTYKLAVHGAGSGISRACITFRLHYKPGYVVMNRLSS